MIFPQLSDNSRVWIYSSDRQFTSEEVDKLKSLINTFVSGWAAHGDQLYGNGDVLYNRFIVLAVDESKVPASGCSIDTSVHFIKDLESRFAVKLFDRMNIWIKENDEFKKIHFSDISHHADSLMFDPMVQTLGELREKWLTPVRETNYL